MPGDLLTDLAIVLGVGAATTLVCAWLHLHVVLGYLVAGVLVGPYVPVSLFADPERVHDLSEAGVVLLMFSIGLELSFSALARVGPIAAIIGVAQSSLMAWLGFAIAQGFGWTPLESLYAGAIVAISSTTIVAKVFEEQGVGGRLREVVIGILIVEDLIAVVLLAMLGMLSGGGAAGSALGDALGRLLVFVTALVGLWIVLVPRLIGALRRVGRAEVTLITAAGLCFGLATLARQLGFSGALGAFLAGSLVAEAGGTALVEPLVRPVRDLFAAVFFVSIGMSIDPRLAATYWAPCLAFAGLVIAGKPLAVSLSAILAGTGIRLAVQSGLALAQIGEFSFVIASLGVGLGAARESVFAVAVVVAAATTLLAPLCIGRSAAIAGAVERRLPARLVAFAAFQATWTERLRRPSTAQRSRAARLLRVLVLDLGMLALLPLALAIALDPAAELIEQATGLPAAWARGAVIAPAVVVAIPLLVGLVRNAAAIGLELAYQALPRRNAADLDLAAAPRRVLVLALQLALVLPIGVVALLVTQPFLPGPVGPLLLAGLLAILGVRLWRGAADFRGHVRAGAQAVLEVLSSVKPAEAPDLGPVTAALPGFGTMASVRIGPGSPGAGRSLGELELGALGATVLAIRRGDAGVVLPAEDERLHEGDVVALSGTDDAIRAAISLLGG